MFSSNNLIPQQQNPGQSPDSSGVNFGILKALKPQQGVVAQLPNNAGQSEKDAGGLLQDLGGMAGKLKRLFTKNPQQPQQQSYNNDSAMNRLANNSDIFSNAMKELGLNAKDPTLSSYLQKANPNLDPNATPWCAGFVGSVLNASGKNGTGSLLAKSYLGYGQSTNNPNRGDIVVFNDLTGNDNPNHGHVGFVDHIDPKTQQVYVLGGNQDNSVSLKAYPISKVAGFRTPPSGQEVAITAQHNGIKNPQQLSNVTKNMSNLSIPEVVKAAQQQYPNNPALAQLTASQAILESGLQTGKPSQLASMHNNLFGIKGNGTAGSTNMPTTEYIHGRKVSVNAPFSSNKSIQDSFVQHANLLQNGTKDNPNRYKDVINAKSFNDAAQAIYKAGYATDPNYVNELNQINNKYVQKYFPSNNNITNSQQSMNTRQSAEPNQINPNEIPEPSIPHELYEDILKQLDNGHDDYAAINSNQQVG